MAKYSYSIYDIETDEVIIDYTESVDDDEVFDSYDDAYEAGVYAISCMELGAEIETQMTVDVSYDTYEVDVVEL